MASRSITNRQRASYNIRRLKKMKKDMFEMGANWGDIDNTLGTQFQEVEDKISSLMDQLQECIDDSSVWGE